MAFDPVSYQQGLLDSQAATPRPSDNIGEQLNALNARNAAFAKFEAVTKDRDHWKSIASRLEREVEALKAGTTVPQLEAQIARLETAMASGNAMGAEVVALRRENKELHEAILDKDDEIACVQKEMEGAKIQSAKNAAASNGHAKARDALQTEAIKCSRSKYEHPLVQPTGQKSNVSGKPWCPVNDVFVAGFDDVAKKEGMLPLADFRASPVPY